MKILIFTVISLIISVCNIEAKDIDLKGFVETSLKESGDKNKMFDYWSDYLPKDRKDIAIYRDFTIPFSQGSKDKLLFTQIFDINACGAYNCPFKVYLEKPDGSSKLVLEGIGPDEEKAFKIKENGKKPVTINIGIMIYDYNEKEGMYVERN